MKALVTKPCSINSFPAKAGDVVDVDAATFENLSRKGWLTEAKDEPAPEPEVKSKSKKP